MIDAHILLATVRPNTDDLQPVEADTAYAAYAEQTHAEILTRALALSVELGKPVVRVEVQYPEESDEQWAATGDALEIDFTESALPTVTSLPPYDEVTP